MVNAILDLEGEVASHRGVEISNFFQIWNVQNDPTKS